VTILKTISNIRVTSKGSDLFANMERTINDNHKNNRVRNNSRVVSYTVSSWSSILIVIRLYVTNLIGLMLFRSVII
jgi:hypothetical protein